MTREERINEMMSKECFKGWSRNEIEEELNSLSDEEVSKGYAIFNFDGTGMLEIEAIGCIDAFECDDEKAVQQAIKDGIKVIPVEELPENFDRRYLGWIDTPENKDRINIYCSMLSR